MSRLAAGGLEAEELGRVLLVRVKVRARVRVRVRVDEIRVHPLLDDPNPNPNPNPPCCRVRVSDHLVGEVRVHALLDELAELGEELEVRLLVLLGLARYKGDRGEI